MKIKTHIKLSHDIREYIHRCTNSQLSPLLFSIGNVLPDLALHMRLRSHTKHHSYGFLLKRIRSLYRKRYRSKAYTSIKLGIITHFISDYFCHPHTEDFKGSLNDHRLYEKHLAHYAKQKSLLTPEHTCAHPIVDDFEQVLNHLFESYQQIIHSFENDIHYALHAARSVAMALAPVSVPMDTLTELKPVTVGEST